MFGRSKPVVFASYGRRRSRWHVPRWLVLLLTGVAVGAAAVVVVEQRYLPPRLSASASSELRAALEQSDAERLRLRDELAETQRRLHSTVAEQQAVADELSSSRATAARLRDDMSAIVESLPPDPRGNPVAVRAGRFTAQAGMLRYDIVLTRERAAGKPMPGTLQLVVAGESDRGDRSTVTAQAIALSVGSHEVVRGTMPLPDGFKPRQTTIQVSSLAGKPVGMRVLPIP